MSMETYKRLFNLFEIELNKEIENISRRNPLNLYEPVVYTLNMGGKRIRPVLLLMAFDLFSSNFNKAIPAALAIELFHNFTLLHDDIMDKSALRRNKDTVHIAFCENTAILSGDAMSILSYEYLSSCDTSNYKEVLSLFNNTALKICEGQQLDMDFEKTIKVSVNDYLNMIGLKTAVLLAASLKLGGLIAETNQTNCDNLYSFGYNLGMAFQLQDDLLDTFGNTENFGKNIGGDIVSNKKTYLMLNALELANNEQKEELLYLTSTNNTPIDSKIKKVISIYNSLNIEQLTKQKITEYYAFAFSALSDLEVENYKKDGLIHIANKMMNRNH
jgi:geranylgeranyl diphosphate synthase, type II